jgi:hypothetical protein
VRTLVLGSIAVALAASRAAADPGAEALFQEGRKLLDAGKLAEACDRFERSLAIEPRSGTALNLGDCREQQGQLADAWEAFMAARQLALRGNDEDDPARVDEAARRATALEPRLAHLTIAVTAPRAPGLAVTRNGKPVAAAALDTDVPVNPGAHEIVATAPGYKRWSTRLALRTGARETATIPRLEVDPAAAHPEASASAVRPPLGRISLGLAFGGTSDRDIIGGVRFVAGYPVPRGAIRATLQSLYTREKDESDVYHHVDLFGTTLGFDFLWAWGPGLASAAGLGVGLDVVNDSYGNGPQTSTWGALRASPLVVRLAAPNLEIGLHFMYVSPNNVLVGVLGVDWYVW